MKKIKLLLSVILTCFLIFITATSTVFAANGTSTAKITVNGQLGKTYEIYKILDLTYSGTNSENVAYTISSQWRDFFFNVDGTKTDNGTKYLLDGKLDEENLNRITYDTNNDGTEFKEYYLNITSNNVAQFAQDALQYTTTNNLTPTDSQSIAADASSLTVEFTNVDLGYYLVYPKGATQISDGYASIASLTNNIKNVTVNIKATYLDIEKEDYEDSEFSTEETGNVYVGQTVYYKVTGTVPDTTGYTNKYTYKIVDTLSAGLVSDFRDIVIKFGDTVIEPTDTELVKGTNTYTLDLDMRDYQEHKGKTITITYSATVTEDAVNSKTTKNTLVLNYSISPKEYNEFETIIEEEYVYSSEVKVHKTLEDNQTSLPGAEFVLYKKDGAKKLYYRALNSQGELIKNTSIVLDDSTVSTSTGVAKVEWTENIDEATRLMSDADGLAIFKGVLDGTYYLKETLVPDGYNRLINDKEVSVTFDGATETNDVMTFDATVNPGVTEVVVANIKGTELPETGGRGTTLFITIGTIISLVAAIILVTNKRMAKETF